MEEYCYAACHFVECRYADGHYTECRSASIASVDSLRDFLQQTLPV
jgi:hypothetical protein